MGKYLAYVQALLLLCLLALASCAGRQHTQRRPTVELDTLTSAQAPTPSLKRGLFRRQAALPPPGVPRKCKGCQITVSYGDNASIKQGSIGKNRAAAAVATDSASLVDQRGASQASAIHGNGNAPVLTQAKPKPTWQELLLGPIGRAVGVILVVVILFLLLVAWLKRRARNA